jgi:hypothetical protein
VRRGVRGTGEHVDELAARRGGRAGDVLRVGRVRGALECAHDLVPARAREVELAHQLVEHLDVVDELPDLFVAHREIGRDQPVDRVGPGGGLVAELRVAALGALDRRVGRGLHEEVDHLPGFGPPTDQHGPVERVQAVQGAPVERVHQALGLAARPSGGVEAEVDHGLDPLAGPLRRYLRGEAEPRGGPGTAPLLADGKGLIVGFRHLQHLGHGHGLTVPGHRPGLDVQLGTGGVEGGSDLVAEVAGDAVFYQLAIVVHGRAVPSNCSNYGASLLVAGQLPAVERVTPLMISGWVTSVAASRRSALRFCSSPNCAPVIVTVAVCQLPVPLPATVGPPR